MVYALKYGSRLFFAFAAVCFAMALWGCAIRVAPVGDSYTKPDGKGGFITSHNPDLRQPKDDPSGWGILGAIGDAVPGPWGYALTGLAALGGGAFAQRKRSEGTIGRISAGVQAFMDANPDHAEPLRQELSKSMDRPDKVIVARVKPKKSKPSPIAQDHA